MGDAQLQQPAAPVCGIRRRSRLHLAGLPLWEIALGPDRECGESRGHARAVIALGDVATGWMAGGGVAVGGIAVGGVAVGLVPVGGLAVGGIALGGAAIGLIAVGGVAVGLAALGGAALGYYAYGGAAFGEHVVTAAGYDPEGLRFFARWLPGWLLPPTGR